MTTLAKIGYGSVFSVLDNTLSPPAYVALAEVTAITPPQMSRDTVDATHNASTGGWREFIPGLKDAGDVTVEMNFIPGNATGDLLMGSFNSDTALSCKIAFPDSPVTEWLFTAICTGFAPTQPIDDKMTASATFKLTGKPAFIPA